MELDNFQKDAFQEIINIASGEVAGVLEGLTGKPVELLVPDMHMIPSYMVTKHLFNTLDTADLITSIQQKLAGTYSGHAFLLFDFDSASTLVELLRGKRLLSRRRLDIASRDVLTEVGNIFLNACLKSFKDVLACHFSPSVPRLQVMKLKDLDKSLVADGISENQYVLTGSTAFNVATGVVTGYLIFVMSEQTWQDILTAIEKFRG